MISETERAIAEVRQEIKRKQTELRKLKDSREKSREKSQPGWKRLRDCYAECGFKSRASMYVAVKNKTIPSHRIGGQIWVDPAEVRDARLNRVLKARGGRHYSATQRLVYKVIQAVDEFRQSTSGKVWSLEPLVTVDRSEPIEEEPIEPQISLEEWIENDNTRH